MTNNSNPGTTTQAIFSPTIALLNRMGYTRKFTLLWAVSLMAIVVVAYGLFVSLDRIIQPSQRQLQGLALIEPISRTIQFIQQHRGVSAALLGGNEAMKDRRASREREAAAAFKAMEEALPYDLTSRDDFLRIKTDWERLRKEGLHWTVAENFDAHTSLIERLLLFEVVASDTYLLTQDPGLASFYMIDIIINKLPNELEHLGQLRAYGTGILSRKQITEAQKIKMSVLVEEHRRALDKLKVDIDRVAQYSPALQSPISVVFKDIAGSVQQLTGLVEADILTSRLATPPDAFLDMATVAIDNSYTQMYKSFLPTARALIEERIARAKKTLLLTVCSALLLFLLVVYITVSIYYAIVGSIRSLVHSAHAFAEGDLNQRVSLKTRDELSEIAESFNRMADGFNAMLDERKQAERALIESREKLHDVVETAMDAVVQMDGAGIITGWNNQAEKIFGWPRYEAVGRMLSETIIPPQYREMHARGLKRFLSTGDGPILNSRVELLGMHRNGREFPVELSVVPIRISVEETNEKYEFSAFIRDITRKKESEELIWKQANFDPLTGLPNRHMFYDRMEQDIKKAHRAGLKMVLLFIDLDQFKEVNDTLGHGMGDILLVEAARRIVECVRETDTVARLGGDEFTVILAELDETESAERVAGNILQRLSEPFQLGDEVVYVSASIGITLYPDDATETESLLKNADQAMYTAKDKGRNRFSYFTSSMQQAAQARLRLIGELRGALATNQLKVFYQPVVDMATCRINKAEALIRWQHPERGLINPAQFIPLAEETGMIVEIGDWVFQESARQLKHWRALYNNEFQISVNVSPVQFHSTNPYNAWSTCLRELGLPGQGMVIEITEGLLLEADGDVTGKLLEFRDVGIQVAIDDFGTGYSSLSYLKKFDIDYLKIDQSFVRNLAADPNDMALAEAITIMAHKLRLKVIAEGVETEEQCKLLSDMGCDYAQGYLFSKPVPAEEFEELLKRAPGRDPQAHNGAS